jgi:hypothetical protein
VISIATNRRDVRAMLNEIISDSGGFFEVGDRIKDTHFKFAGELVAGGMAVGISQADQVAKLEADLEQISGLLPIIERMEKLLLMYLDARGLI